jgi:hypothetical protein
MDNTCLCRNCGNLYAEDKATADWKGYCTQACFHAKAKAHGFKKRNEKFKGMSEYSILSRAKQIGSVFVRRKDGKTNDVR